MNTIYIVSDVHLGATSSLDPKNAKRNFISFLKSIEPESKLIILGDLFDFFLKKGNKVIFGERDILLLLKKLTQRGVKITIFSGNHDFWIGNFIKSFGIDFVRFNKTIRYSGKILFLSHGDLYFNGSKFISFINLLSKSFLFYLITRIIPEDILFSIIKFASARERNPKRRVNPYYEFCEKNRYDIFILGHYHTTDIIRCGGKILVTPGDFATKNTYIKIKDNFLYLMRGNVVADKIQF